MDNISDRQLEKTAMSALKELDARRGYGRAAGVCCDYLNERNRILIRIMLGERITGQKARKYCIHTIAGEPCPRERPSHSCPYPLGACVAHEHGLYFDFTAIDLETMETFSKAARDFDLHIEIRAEYSLSRSPTMGIILCTKARYDDVTPRNKYRDRSPA